MKKQVETPKIDLCFEDVVLGEKIETHPHAVTIEDILKFADVTRDHHPLHTDPEYCAETRFGKPIAHGLYGLSLMEGLKAETKMYETTSIASLGWDKVRFRGPVFPGDMVHVQVRFLDKRGSSKAGRGVVTEKVELINQNGQVVTDAEHVTLLMTRESWRRVSHGEHRSSAGAGAT